jgi:ribosomal protein S27E
MRKIIIDMPNAKLKTAVEKEMVEMQMVNKHTRAGRNGSTIRCSKCKHIATVYHFSWCIIVCNNCKSIVKKEEWEVV